jgi:polyisoprenoid-binding protein YceI
MSYARASYLTLTVGLGLAVLTGCEDKSEPPKKPAPVQAAPQKATAEDSNEGQGESDDGPASLPSEALGTYEVDPAHSTFVFKGDHFGYSYTYGLFNKVTGTFDLKEDVSKSSVKLEVAADSLFTGNKKRDDHLKGPDFFNAAQFPTITFESTKVEKASNGYKVTGNLTMHGESKPVTVVMEHVGSGPFQMDDSYRTGFHGTLTVDRTEFGVDHMAGKISNEVELIASIEGKK